MKIEYLPTVKIELLESEKEALVRTIRKVTANLSELNGDYAFLHELLGKLNAGRKL